MGRFQCLEAPIVTFSTAASSAEEAPRLGLLLSVNRVNVAILRAQGLAVTSSPTLLQVRCHTPAKMRLVNALCRRVEVASQRWVVPCS